MNSSPFPTPAPPALRGTPFSVTAFLARYVNQALPSHLVWRNRSLSLSLLISLLLPEMCRDHLWCTWNSLFPSAKLFPFRPLSLGPKIMTLWTFSWLSRLRPPGTVNLLVRERPNYPSNLMVYTYIHFGLYRCSCYWGLLAHLGD